MSIGFEVGSFSGARVLLRDLGTDSHTFEFGLGIETIGEDAVQLQGSRNWIFMEHKSKNHANLSWYLGYGGRLKFESETRVGAMMPVGFNWVMPSGTWEFFVELVPILDLTPDVVARFNAGAGLRWYL